jgi:murein L,D-transpeptidase YcbB/YkuD
MKSAKEEIYSLVENNMINKIFKNNTSKPHIACMVIAFVCLFSSCKLKNSAAHISENKIEIPKDNAEFQVEMSEVLKAYLPTLITIKNEKEQYLSWHEIAKEVYEQRQYQPIWVSKNVLSSKGKEMLEFVGTAEFLGLNKDLYDYENLRLLADSAMQIQPAINFSIERDLETGLTRAFLQIALHIDKGMFVDTSVGLNSNFWLVKDNYIALFQKALNDSVSTIMATLEPTNPMYKRYMSELRNFVSKNNISSHPISIRNPKTDSVGAINDAKIALVYHHFLLDSLKKNDTAYVLALKQFQKENNLNADGQIGANTIKALERDNSTKFQLLAINADRWRKEHIITLPELYVWVNLPSFKVKIIENDSVKLEKNTVIGKTVLKNETPILESSINQVVLWPTWSVPQSIIKHEMKSFKGYTVTTTNGYTSVVQPPGPKNSLGAVKILFPNKYSVYMHDTPAKSLFNADFRAASHGCVRCQDALEIAAFLLERDTFNINYDSLKALKERKIETKVFRLKNKIPVYFRYFTAEAGFDGNMKFYADVYRRDKDMINFIFNGKKPHQPTKAEKREQVIKDSLATEKKKSDSLFVLTKTTASSKIESPNVLHYSPKADTTSARQDSL